MDSDILVNPMAPDVFASVGAGQVGAVENDSFPTKWDSQLVSKLRHSRWSQKGILAEIDESSIDFHAEMGIDTILKEVVQTGVIVLSPRHHSATLRKVYDQYEGRPERQWCYEMAPVSYELQINHEVVWLDPKFNAIWFNYALLHYHFLLLDQFQSIQGPLLHFACTNAFLSNYFLHFAGTMEEMFLANTSASSLQDVTASLKG